MEPKGESSVNESEVIKVGSNTENSNRSPKRETEVEREIKSDLENKTESESKRCKRGNGVSDSDKTALLEAESKRSSNGVNEGGKAELFEESCSSNGGGRPAECPVCDPPPVAKQDAFAMTLEGGHDLLHICATTWLKRPAAAEERVRPLAAPTARNHNPRVGGGVGDVGGAAALREFTVTHDELVGETGNADEQLCPDQVLELVGETGNADEQLCPDHFLEFAVMHAEGRRSVDANPSREDESADQPAENFGDASLSSDGQIEKGNAPEPKVSYDPSAASGGKRVANEQAGAAANEKGAKQSKTSAFENPLEEFQPENKKRTKKTRKMKRMHFLKLCVLQPLRLLDLVSSQLILRHV